MNDSLIKQNVKNLLNRYKIIKFSIILIVVLNFLGSFLFYISYAYRDEAMYILNALQLCGQQNNYNNSYSIGYSLLLVPFYCIFEYVKPYECALILNLTLLAFIIALCNNILVLDSDDAGGERRLENLLIIAVITVYPSITLFAKHAIPEVALMATVLGQYYLIGKYQKTNSAKWLLLFAVVSALAFMLHTRMLGLVISCCIIIIYEIIFNKNKKIGYASLLLIIILIILYYFINAYLINLANISIHDSNSSLINDPYKEGGGVGILNNFIQKPFASGLNLVSAVAGQLLYLYISTAGIFVITMIGFFFNIKYKEKQNNRWNNIKDLNLIMSFILCIVIAGFQKSYATLPDQFIFGRYMDVFTPLLLLIGLKRLSKSRSDIIKYNFLITSLFIGILLVALIYIRNDSIILSESMRQRFWTIPAVNYLFQLYSRISIVYFFIIGFIIQVFFFIIFKHFKYKIYICLLFLFFFLQSVLISLNSYIEYVYPRSLWRSNMSEILTRYNISSINCIGYDIESGFHWLAWDFGVTNFTYKLVFFRQSEIYSLSDLKNKFHYVFSKNKDLQNNSPDFTLIDCIQPEPKLYIYKVK